MALCARCNRPLPPNHVCHFCGSPEFHQLEGSSTRRGKMDALRVFVRRLFWLAVVGGAAWFFLFHEKGKEIVGWFR